MGLVVLVTPTIVFLTVFDCNVGFGSVVVDVVVDFGLIPSVKSLIVSLTVSDFGFGSL